MEEIEFEDDGSNEEVESDDIEMPSDSDDQFCDSDDEFGDSQVEFGDSNDEFIDSEGGFSGSEYNESEESDRSEDQWTLESKDITMKLFEKSPEFYLGIQKNNLYLADIITSELNISKRDLYIILFKLRRAEPDKSIADRCVN